MFRYAPLAILASLLSTSLCAEWLEVERGTHPVTIETSGVVASKNTTLITPPPSFFWNLNIGEIVEEGKRVEPGDKLVRFEATREDERLMQLTQQLRVSEGELASLAEKHNQEIETEKLNLAQAKSDADKARRKATQPADLIPSVEYQKLVKQRELADRRVGQLVRRAEVSAKARESRKRKLELAVKRSTRALASARSDKERLTVHASRAGIVIIGTSFNGEKFDVGSMTQPNQVILELVDDATLEVRGDVREEQAAQLDVGQKVRMYVESAGGIEISGRIVSIGDTVRRRSRFAEEMIRDFRVSFDRQPEGVKLGVSVQMVIEVQSRENTFAVPRDAIQYRNDVPGVVTRSGWQRVYLGARSNGKIIVTEGLTIGEEVQI
ncbi:MAG: efflux RND transporter periplasmic adaptor subunit [Gammaproteobacteria bacterium]|nr:efflux RND transporter periplasmic adaptor subunit [Gammaproteobacteria bacterium]